MRILACLPLLAAAAAAQDLRPRDAGGWEGLGRGSKVKLKFVNAPEGRVPRVTMREGELTKVGEKTLEVTWKTRNLAIEREQVQKLRREGHPHPGEKAKRGEPGDEVVRVGKREVPCVKVRTVVTSDHGKRVVTEWTAKRPKAIVRQVVVQYGPKGKKLQTETFHLVKLKETRTVKDKPVLCRKYRVTRRYGGDGGVERGEAYLSRDVPGGTVFIETVLKKNGKAVRTQRIQCTDFAVK